MASSYVLLWLTDKDKDVVWHGNIKSVQGLQKSFKLFNERDL